MATAESVKAKLQALIADANAKTGKTDTSVTDAVRTLVGGYGQGGGVIDVGELPTENAIEGAVYRVGGAAVDLYYIFDSECGYLNDIAATQGATVVYYVVDEPPSVAEFSTEMVLHLYVVSDTGLVYVNEGNGVVLLGGDESAYKGWATPEEIEALDKTDPNNGGIYTVNRGSEELYIYSNGSWNMLNGIITVETLSTANLNMNAIYRKPKIGAECYWVYEDANFGRRSIPLFQLVQILGALDGARVERMHYIVVDDLSAISSPLLKTDTAIFAYVDADGIPYTFDGNGFVPVLGTDNVEELHGWIDHKPDGSEDFGVYTVRKTEYDYYLPRQGGFTKIAPIDFVRDSQEAAIYMPYNSIIDRTVTDANTGNDVNRVGAYAFAECSDLQTITIGGKVHSIGECAFYECTSLKSVTFKTAPDWIDSYYVMRVAPDAFLGCTALTDIYVPWSEEAEGFPEDHGNLDEVTPASEWAPINATVHYNYTE